jgi:hypothetical protein
VVAAQARSAAQAGSQGLHLDVRRAPPVNDPRTPEQWQDAVDAAEGALRLHAARMYGLVKGGPGVDVVRCVEILEAGRARGVTPAPDAVERFIRELSTGGST